MSGYSRAEARDWAREKLVGAVNCTIPSFTGDLRGINEAAIRHDVRRAKEHGFIGTLGVSEVSITLPEYRGRGLYRATVAKRAELARERGYRWLYSDALPTSRPILERLGFVAITTTTPFVTTSAAKPATPASSLAAACT